MSEDNTEFIPHHKITPNYDLSWYIKWVATIMGIISAILSSLNIFPVNLIFLVFTLGGWAIVGGLWKDRAMLIANIFPLIFIVYGIVNHYLNL